MKGTKVKIIFVLIFLSFLSNYSFSQRRALDSIYSLLRTVHDDTSRVRTLNRLAWIIRNRKTDTSIVLSKEALDLSVKLKWNEGIAHTCQQLGEFFWEKDEYALSLEYYIRSLTLWEKIHPPTGSKDASICLGNMGLVYYSMGDYPKALDCYFRAMKLSEEPPIDRHAIARHVSNIGIIYYEQKDYVKTLKYFYKGLKMEEELGEKGGVAIVLANLGNVYQEQGNYDKALECDFKALKLARELNNKYGESSDLGNIANVYRSLGDIAKKAKNKIASDSLQKKAFAYYTEALGLAETLADKSLVELWTGNLGALYLSENKLKEAEQYSKKALILSREIGDLDGMKEWNGYLSEIYAATKQWELAAKHYKDHIKAKDSLFSTKNIRKTVQLQMQYDFEKKELAAKTEQDKKDLVVEEDKQQQRIIIASISFGLLLVLILVIVIFRNLRLNQKKNEIITQQKLLVEHQKALVEEKQKEILDSIYYARRIQRSLITSEKYIESRINKLQNKG